MVCKVKTGVSFLRAFHRKRGHCCTVNAPAEFIQDISLLEIISHGFYFMFKIEMCFVFFPSIL